MYTKQTVLALFLGVAVARKHRSPHSGVLFATGYGDDDDMGMDFQTNNFGLHFVENNKEGNPAPSITAAGPWNQADNGQPDEQPGAGSKKQIGEAPKSAEPKTASFKNPEDSTKQAFSQAECQGEPSCGCGSFSQKPSEIEMKAKSAVAAGPWYEIPAVKQNSLSETKDLNNPSSVYAAGPWYELPAPPKREVERPNLSETKDLNNPSSVYSAGPWYELPAPPKREVERPNLSEIKDLNNPSSVYSAGPWYELPAPPKREAPQNPMSLVTLNGADEEPEKVHSLQPLDYQESANTNTPNRRTTFYNKKAGLWMESHELVQEDDEDTEKVHVLEPLKYQWKQDHNTPFMRTTFYSQLSDEPEKVHVLEPEVYQERANTNKPNIRTTFYGQESF